MLEHSRVGRGVGPQETAHDEPPCNQVHPGYRSPTAKRRRACYVGTYASASRRWSAPEELQRTTFSTSFHLILHTRETRWNEVLVSSARVPRPIARPKATCIWCPPRRFAMVVPRRPGACIPLGDPDGRRTDRDTRLPGEPCPFERLPESTLDSLPKRLSVRYVRRGSEFPPQDDPEPCLYILRRGAAEMRDEDGNLAGKLAEGDLCPSPCGGQATRRCPQRPDLRGHPRLSAACARS
jgi:hypothetical protein